MKSVAVVILAAGVSGRLGRAKQLLKWGGETLIERAIRLARDVQPVEVVTVLGARRDKIEPVVTRAGATVVVNRDWQKGMASSLQCGLHHVETKHHQIDAVLFMVCDQPYLTSSILGELIASHHPVDEPLVAAEYKGRPGTPALFDRSLFGELHQLTGDRGAKPLFERYSSILTTVPFPRGEIDIDRVQDWEELNEL